MLEQAIKDQVVNAFSGLKSEFTFKVEVEKNHKQKDDLVTLLNDVASCSEKITIEVFEGTGLSFTIEKNKQKSNINFKAVPTGHEFTTLLLAVLNMDGIGKNLPDELISERVKSITEELEIRSFISLTCTNCPEVVQALNIISMLNPNIKHQIIDGALHKDEIESLGIQAVPTIFVNGKQLHVGRASLVELLGKIEEFTGNEYKASSIKEKKYDVVVVGGGPAGVSAAVYSARKGFSVALVAEKIGGQVAETVSIENMISVKQTTGAKLTSDLKSHLQDYEIDILENRWVESINLNDGHKIINTSLGEKFITPALIISTGASWRKLGVPGEKEYLGSGVAFCTHCDGPFYKGKKVVVIGGGNSGLEAAIDLSAIATDVTVLEFLDEIKGDKVLQDKLETLDNVSVITRAETTEIIGDGNKVTALNYKNRDSGSEIQLETDGVFVQIGLIANSKVFSNVVKTNRMGEIEIDANCRTNVPGIYAAGDVSVVPYKQIVIAMGEGSKAALSAFEDKIKNRQTVNAEESVVA